MKNIAVINDISGFGRCSLTAAIAVISAMGVQPCPLPTAVLTAQTGYDSYYCDDYTDKMDIFTRQWELMGASFDGIYTGFLTGDKQIQKIFSFLKVFKTENNFLLADPVMGDGGKPYKMFTPELLREMTELVSRADITTPNLTELCLLTGEDYHRLMSVGKTEEYFGSIEAAGKRLCAAGPKKVIVTGVHHREPDTGRNMIGNMYITPSTCRLVSFPCVGGSYSGTGDLFASVIAAGEARGTDTGPAVELAGSFLEAGLEDACRLGMEKNGGIPFERHLNILINSKQQSERVE